MATGVKISQLEMDDVITGSEKVLISDDGQSKYATVDQLKEAIGNEEKITYLTNKINELEQDSDPWTEYVG